MKAIIVLALVACATAANIPARPVHPAFAQWNRSPKIVGGAEVKPNSIPFQVALFLGDYFCGGSLIAAKWVLTAAHCGELTNTPQVVLGAHNVRDTSEPNQVIINGKRPIVHPDWDDTNLVNDISLIELPQAAPLSKVIAIVPLAAANAPNFVGSTATASGWGLPSDSATTISPVLRSVQNKIISNADCEDQFGFGAVPASQVCLSGAGGKSTCSGDSGGPLVVDGTQIGLTSYGISLGCELGYPAAFTRVSSFRNWVDKQIGA